jgi:hypothetical protein
MRFGVAFSELKARLIDTIRRAGEDGISTDDILSLVFSDRNIPSRLTVKAHIAQVNDLLASTDFRVRSRLRRYVFVREVQK